MHVVAHHIEICRSWPITRRQRVRVKRSSKGGVGLSFDLLHQPGVGDRLNEDRRDVVVVDLANECRDIGGSGLGLGIDASRCDELEAVGGGEVTKRIVRGDDRSPVWRMRATAARISSSNSASAAR
jgi:hypothetical protein